MGKRRNRGTNRPNRKLFVARLILYAGCPMLATAVGYFLMISMPGRSFSGPLPPLTQEEEEVRDRLKQHIEMLAGEIGERNLWQYEALERSAAYIETKLKEAQYQPADQFFEVKRKKVRNLEAEVAGTESDEIVLVGGHYDSVHSCPGANDNGTGAAAVLEMARLLAGRRFRRMVRFVAFVNEEPPFFQTGNMGSLMYARRCRERNEKIVAMFSMETIGYYSDAVRSQRYPFPFSFFYPDTGNFIAFVGNAGSRNAVREAIRSFREHTSFPSEGAAVPGGLPGIGWSDHWSFWKCGYPGVMVTDTATFRYPHYHLDSDTPDKVDYDRTARVVVGMTRVVAELAGEEQVAGR